jgi:hypothetical protein
LLCFSCIRRRFALIAAQQCGSIDSKLISYFSIRKRCAFFARFDCRNCILNSCHIGGVIACGSLGTVGVVMLGWLVGRPGSSVGRPRYLNTANARVTRKFCLQTLDQSRARQAMMKLDPSVVKLLGLDASITSVSPAGGGGCSSASTSKIVSKLPDGTETSFFMKTGSGEDAKIMFEGWWILASESRHWHTDGAR